MQNQLVLGVVKIMIHLFMVVSIFQLNFKSGSTLTDTTKTDIITQLKKFSVASVTPVIVDPETTSVLLTSTIKYDEKQTTKTSTEIKTLVTNAVTNYNTNTLQKFDSVLRYSKLLETIDDADTSILSNITTLKLRKTFTPTLSTSTNYTVSFLTHYIIHTLVIIQVQVVY